MRMKLAMVVIASGCLTAGDGPTDGRGETRIYRLEPSTHGNPEGIAYDNRTGAFFVGATGDGTIYRGTLNDPAVREFIPGAPGGEAAGMKVWRGKLFVAGGFSGAVTVYDIATRKTVASFGGFGAGMLNDLVVTERGDVYITDSFVPMLWHITRAQVAAGGGAPKGIPVDPEIEYDFGPFSFNLNGIVSLRGGRSVIVVHSQNGKLFRIDFTEDAPFGRRIQPIAVEPFPGGDGLLLDGGDLVVVQGFPSAAVSFVRLNGAVDRGRVIERRSDPSLREPSTVARARDYYLIVNADFTSSVLPFTVTGLPRNYGDEEEQFD
jgi:sugar lactone lactonase YvrE